MQQVSLSEEIFWQAINSRDTSLDGVFFYGVHSTHIYCRPSCPSRKPNRNQVIFFRKSEEAEAAGYRPCKRCQPQYSIAPNSAYAKVLATCRYIEAQVEHIPTLAELGAHVSTSPAHLQRIFKQITGVTPFQYADVCRMERFKKRLKQGDTIANALYETGYGASSRLYEKAPQQLGMTPASYQKHGQGETIRYAIASSPLGEILVAATTRGLCCVRLGETATALLEELKQEFAGASLQSGDDELYAWTQALVDYLSGRSICPSLPLDVQATVFQLLVWEALRKIPIGSTASYSDIAQAIAQPKSVRAVARACATNPVALVIPCHRVVQKDGGLGGYRWGVSRKEALLNLEQGLGRGE
ncbi:bifunctional DNA-binding transcriptional regulator/O6-methylguanine-DNA methyltransferase Ada [Chlorogloeopsis sp. ULAP02]|uniref:bifunctional DNA-binding transcriptional regulator/O6-methylguanine-DNA methyltransferase Ada n=1 Tax=Chlorogloeopsis sp. ULAP02 TaxID=3107926 RepID=UPI003136E0C4